MLLDTNLMTFIHLSQDGTCAYNASYPQIPLLKNIYGTPSGSESALQTAVGTVGPVTVGIDASKPTFQQYSSGMYNFILDQF